MYLKKSFSSDSEIRKSLDDTDQSEKWTVTSGVRKVQTVYKTAAVVEYFDVIGLYAKKIENF